jgi:phosphoglycolate phosphatase
MHKNEHPSKACPNTLELVIFDCDGVLVDSESLSNIVLSEMLVDFGVRLTPQESRKRFGGFSATRCLEILRVEFNLILPDNFFLEFNRRLRRIYESKLEKVPGIDTVLEKLRTPYCVASNSDPEKLHMTLRLTGLLERFLPEHIFSCAAVIHPKPAPDLFLYAARHCGVLPMACVVIEDSPIGVQAAVAAGMTVYGFSASGNSAQLLAAGATLVFTDMLKLIDLLPATTISSPS